MLKTIKNEILAAMANCKFCGKEITWLKDGRKFVPVQSDGDKHSCEQMKKSLKSVKVLDRNSISAEEIARYEENMRQQRLKKK